MTDLFLKSFSINSSIILWLLIFLLPNNSYGDSGIFDAYAIYSLNGSANTYTQAGSFNNMIFDNPSSLVLKGGQNKTYKNNNSNVTGGGLQYRIYNSSGTPPSFTNSGLFLFIKDIGNGDQIWEKADASINVLSGLTPGIYTIEIYFEAYTSDGNKYYNNNGANYKATIIVYNKSNTSSGYWNAAGSWTSGIPTIDQPIMIQSGHSITLDANASIKSLTINSGGNFYASDASPRTLTITKSTAGSSATLINNGFWYNGTGGSTVVFTGAPGSGDAIHSISGNIPFQNITVNKTSGASNVGASFGSGSNVLGTLEIGAGGFIATAPPTGFYTSTAILKFNQGAGATYDVNAGDYTWSTTEVPQNITISSGTVNLNATRTATGNLVINGGTLSLAAGLTIQGNWTRSSGTFTPNTQTVTLSGSTNTTINTNTEASLYDLVVNKTGSAYVSLSSSLNVTHNLTISSGYLTVPDAKALTVAGTLTNSAGASGLVVKSGGSLIQNSAVQATVERYIPAWTAVPHGWHFLSSPVTAQAVSPAFTDATPANYDFYKWNEATNYWLTQKDGTNSITNFDPGAGYLVAYASAATRKFTGTLNSTNVTISNLGISAGTNKGWHLLGNPFSSAIAWGSCSRTNINATAKIWNESTAAYVDITSGIIPSMNGFMVQVSSGTGSVTIPTTARVHDATAWYKSGQAQELLLVATDPDGQTSQESKIRLDAASTAGFDTEFDSHFLAGYAPQFYSREGNELLSTNSLPSLPAESIIPFGFVKNESTQFSIELKQNIDGFTPYLKDLKTNTVQNLAENPVYTFTSEAGDDPNRFELSFLAPTGLDKTSTKSSLRVYSTTGKINISGVDGKAEVLVRNMMGQVVMRNSVNGEKLYSVNSAKLPAGVYVVSVVSGRQTVSEKVVVK